VFAALRQGAATFSKLSSVVTATLHAIKVLGTEEIRRRRRHHQEKRTASAGF
jgi:hypothetical protein